MMANGVDQSLIVILSQIMVQAMTQTTIMVPTNAQNSEHLVN